MYRNVGMYICHVILQHSPPLVQPLVMMTFVLQYGWSPLYKASDAGHLDIVKTLIEAGNDVNQATKKVQCVGRLHVASNVIVIYEHTYVLCVCQHSL